MHNKRQSIRIYFIMSTMGTMGTTDAMAFGIDMSTVVSVSDRRQARA